MQWSRLVQPGIVWFIIGEMLNNPYKDCDRAGSDRRRPARYEARPIEEREEVDQRKKAKGADRQRCITS